MGSIQLWPIQLSHCESPTLDFFSPTPGSKSQHVQLKEQQAQRDLLSCWWAWIYRVMSCLVCKPLERAKSTLVAHITSTCTCQHHTQLWRTRVLGYVFHSCMIIVDSAKSTHVIWYLIWRLAIPFQKHCPNLPHLRSGSGTCCPSPLLRGSSLWRTSLVESCQGIFRTWLNTKSAQYTHKRWQMKNFAS